MTGILSSDDKGHHVTPMRHEGMQKKRWENVKGCQDNARGWQG